MTAFAADIGGTKIQLTVFTDALAPLRSWSIPTGLLRRGTPAFATDLLGLLLAHRVQDHQRLGLVLNGVLRQGHVEYSSLMGGQVDFPLQQFLSDQLGMPVRVDDDIHAMALAEYTLGLGQGCHSLAMVNLGTGIGVGFVSDGVVLRGEFAAGLVSEQLVWVDELQEWRSLDRTVCGRGLKDMYGCQTGQPVEAITVMRRYASGEAAAGQVVRAFVKALAWTLQLVSRFYHPEVISLNGSVAQSWELFGQDVVTAYHAGLERCFHAKVLELSTLSYPAERGVLA